MKKHKLSFEYSKITDKIYIGTNQCCQIHFKKELLDKGITVDISLEDKRLDSAEGAELMLWLPTKDHYSPSLKNLELGAKFIESCVKAGKKLYVHCKFGHTRAPTLVAAYLIKKGMTTQKAIAYIVKKRQQVHLSKRQIEALKRFEKKSS